MQLHTASETISFIREFENRIADYFEGLAGRFPAQADTFRTLAGENRKYVATLEQAYYSVITDAIEGGFAFDINPDDYVFDTALPENAALSNAVNRAVELEQTLIRFYETAAEQSKSLLADVPRAMQQILKKKHRRLDVIKGIAGAEKA